jgi:hypothetical protein
MCTPCRLDGPVVIPLFDSLERDLAAARSEQDTVDRAKPLLRLMAKIMNFVMWAMSASDRITDSTRTSRDVRKVPETEVNVGALLLGEASRF